MKFAVPSKPKAPHSVTVVIPCYKYGRYLGSAVRNALAQTHVDVRVIIVDDHSPDNSLTVARELAEADSRIRVIAHEQNKGHIQTYNDGLAEVETEFATLVSADDIVAPGSLDRAVAVMERFPAVGLVYGKVVTFEQEPLPRSRSKADGLWKVVSGREFITQVVKRGFNPILSPEAVVRTDALRSVGGYNDNLPHSGDLEYWLRIASGWDVAQIRGAVQAYYRVHGANMHLVSYSRTIDDVEQKLAAMDFMKGTAPDGQQLWTTPLYTRGAQTLADEALAAAKMKLVGDSTDEGIALAEFVVRVAPRAVQRDAAASLLASVRGPESS